MFRTSTDPFYEMRRLTRQMDRLMSQPAAGAAGGGAFPPMNVHAGPDGIAITAEVPGLSADDLEISVHRDTVTLKGQRDAAPEGAKAWHRRERGTGRFVRTLSLPYAVDPEKVEASLADGVLKLSLHRPEADKPRRIEVKAS
ncbi:heat shock protein Hsp20 [Hasllibacter halocynthiae]|uniref:Heat shock protein Hsp20 n=1 Tax=Hasllibacter halocynthiae TaxID=595589 RepID=A0A2T0X1U7_9RHOB|nr:Hsp20/alpha crystallin family protein [Hasllibacter halocynthiae]PRY92834.1 heat shock protein Hsp20 [Hasllibacter halocynthiae]